MSHEHVEDEVFVDVEDAEEVGLEDEGAFDPQPPSWVELAVR